MIFKEIKKAYIGMLELLDEEKFEKIKRKRGLGR